MSTPRTTALPSETHGSAFLGSSSRRRRRRRSIRSEDDEDSPPSDDDIKLPQARRSSQRKPPTTATTSMKSKPKTLATSRFDDSSSEEEDEEVAMNDIKDDYDFILSAIGGEASEKQIKQLLKDIGAPQEYWQSSNPDTVDEREGEDKGYDAVETVDVARSLGFDDNSFIRDDDGIHNDNDLDHVNISTVGTGTIGNIHRPSQRDMLTNDDIFRRDINNIRNNNNNIPSAITRRGSMHENQRASITILKKPSTKIQLNNVVRRELVFTENAHLLNIAIGNDDDDEACQSAVTFDDWLLSAEHLVGLSSHMTTCTTTGQQLQTRRIWSALFESRIFDKLGITGGMSESHMATVTGLCLRLLNTGGLQPDMASRLLKELLKVREKQMKTGGNVMDSLYVILSGANLNQGVNQIAFRHKAIVAIWAGLVHTARGGYHNNNINADSDLDGDIDKNDGIRKLLKDELNETIDDIFESMSSMNDRNVGGGNLRSVGFGQIENKISSFIDTLRIISFTSAVKLDIFGNDTDMEHDDDEKINDDLVSHLWPVMVELLERFERDVKSLGKIQKVKFFLTCLLENAAYKLCTQTWPVEDTILSACSKAVIAAARRGSVSTGSISCFCEHNPIFATRLDDIGRKITQPSSSSSSSTSENDILKTPCDYLMYIGRQYVKYGVGGNEMKRVMNVIRHGAPLTNVNQNTKSSERLNTTSSTSSISSPAVKAIRHHVGVVLSIADVMADNVGGEQHVLKMLISKGTDLKSVLKSVHINQTTNSPSNNNRNGEEDEKWDVLYKAIIARCESIINRKRTEDSEHTVNIGVDVYLKWLGDGVVEGFHLMKRVAERRATVKGEREALRVQEGILNAAVMKRVKAFKNIVHVVWKSVDCGQMDIENMISCVVMGFEPCVKLFAFCKECIVQMRMNVDRSRDNGNSNGNGGMISKSRDVMLVDVLQVLQLVLRLLAYVTTSTTTSDGFGGFGARFIDTDDYNNVELSKIRDFVKRSGYYTSLITTEHDAIMTDIMTFDGLLADNERKNIIKQNAAMVSSLMVDIRVKTGDSGWGGTCNDIGGADDSCEALVGLVRNCKLDVVNVGRASLVGAGRFGVGGGVGTSKQGSDCINEGCMIRFWWWGVKSGWVKEVFLKFHDIRAAILGMISWIIVSEEFIISKMGSEEIMQEENGKMMVAEIKRTLKTWECMQLFVNDWPLSESDEVGAGECRELNALCGSGRSKCMKEFVKKVAGDYGRPWTRALISQLRPKAVSLMKSRKKNLAADGLQILGILLEGEADARGFCAGGGAKWMQEWFAEICEGIQRRSANKSNLNNNNNNCHQDDNIWEIACEFIQKRVMGALGLVTSDGREGELRMFVLRLLNVMGARDDLRGIWCVRDGSERLRFGGGGMNNGMSDEMKKKARRNVQAWKTYVFRSVVEENVIRGSTGGKPVAFGVRRLAAAVDSAMQVDVSMNGITDSSGRDDILLALAKAVVHRIRNAGLENTIMREGGATVTWRRVCSRLGLDVS